VQYHKALMAPLPTSKFTDKTPPWAALHYSRSSGEFLHMHADTAGPHGCRSAHLPVVFQYHHVQKQKGIAAPRFKDAVNSSLRAKG